MRRAVFLDRDGTLNEDSGYFHEASKLVMLPGVAEALFKLKQAGYMLLIFTNQGAIGKGMYPLEDMVAVHDAIQTYLKPFSAQIDDFFYCPHVEADNCNCRKPKPGMIFEARDKYALNLEESYVVGDKISDLQAGRAAGCRTILVLTGHGKEEQARADAQKLNVADCVVKDMAQAAKVIAVDAMKRGLVKHR